MAIACTAMVAAARARCSKALRLVQHKRQAAEGFVGVRGKLPAFPRSHLEAACGDVYELCTIDLIFDCRSVIPFSRAPLYHTITDTAQNFVSSFLYVDHWGGLDARHICLSVEFVRAVL